MARRSGQPQGGTRSQPRPIPPCPAAQHRHSRPRQPDHPQSAAGHDRRRQPGRPSVQWPVPGQGRVSRRTADRREGPAAGTRRTRRQRVGSSGRRPAGVRQQRPLARRRVRRAGHGRGHPARPGADRGPPSILGGRGAARFRTGDQFDRHPVRRGFRRRRREGGVAAGPAAIVPPPHQAADRARGGPAMGEQLLAVARPGRHRLAGSRQQRRGKRRPAGQGREADRVRLDCGTSPCRRS